MRPLIVLSAIRSSSPPSARGRDRADPRSSRPVWFSAAKRSPITQLAASFGVAALARPSRRNRPSPARRPARRHRRPTGRNRAMKRAFLASGSSGSVGLQLVDPGRVEHQRQQIGIGEIAVVVRVFLAAHRPRHAAAGIEQPRLLLDRAAALPHLDLAPRLVLDRLHDEADRVDVLDLAARAERLAGLAHRDVDVAAHASLPPCCRRRCRDSAGSSAACADRRRPPPGVRISGSRDDLHQRHAGAVEVDDRSWSDAGRAATCRRPAPDAAA